jgi:2,5-diketo-D-gluconate reductase B
MAIPSPGLGTSGMTGAECRTAVERALSLGYRHVDTAQMYDNEAAVGAAVAASEVAREAVYLASKVHPDNLAPEEFERTTRASLERLGVERLDLLYVHWPMRAYDPEGTLDALARAQSEGLTEAVAVSNFTPDLLRAAVDRLDVPVVANQFECHPLLPQTELRAVCAELDVTPVAYSPVMQGRSGEVPELVTVAERHDATPTQVALAWLAAVGAVPIPKATGDHLAENWAARDLELTETDHATIEGIDRRERLVDPEGAPWN